MTEAVFDFAAINRRLNRKPEPMVLVVTGQSNYTGPAGPEPVDAWKDHVAPGTVLLFDDKIHKMWTGAEWVEVFVRSPSAFNEAARKFWMYGNCRDQCNQLQDVVDRAYTRQIEALRASLDETETVFIGWDTNGGPA